MKARLIQPALSSEKNRLSTAIRTIRSLSLPVLHLKKATPRSRQRSNRARFAAVLQLPAIARPFTSVTSLENLQGIEPIAEALIKTLAGKARTGRLDELKALELLQQAVLL